MSFPIPPSDGNSPDEYLGVVNEADEEIGSERRCVIHERGLLHRAVHVLVRRPDGLVLIQQRSALKDTFPLHWECVGGHMAPGEAYRAAAEREVQEELGVAARDFLFLGKVPACDATRMEFIEFYSATILSEPVPDATEVLAVEWIAPDDLRREIESAARLYSPVFIKTLAATGALDRIASLR